MNTLHLHSLQLLDALEAHLDHLITVESELETWQQLAQQRRMQLDQRSDQFYRLHAQFAAERDGLKQERDMACDALANLVKLLLPLLKALDQGDFPTAPDLISLRALIETAVLLLPQTPDLSGFLDRSNLDSHQEIPRD